MKPNPMVIISVAFPDKLLKFVDDYACKIRMNRSELIRGIADFYIKINKTTIKMMRNDMKNDNNNNEY